MYSARFNIRNGPLTQVVGFQGVFHANPDYALWYGWSEMVRDLSEIKHMSKELRADKDR